MKKAIGPILGLILLLLLGSPWFVGKQIESFYTEVTNEALEKNPSLEMSEFTYQRGWFTSTITGGIRVAPMAPDQPLPIEIRYKSTLTHGPIFWGALSSSPPMGLALDDSTLWTTAPDETEKRLDKVLQELPPLKMKSTIGFDKVIATVYNIAAYTQALSNEKGDINLHFEGLNGTSLFQWDSQDFDFQAEIPSFHMNQGEGQKFLIDNLILSAHREGPDSSARYEIHKISVESQGSNTHITLDTPYVEGRYTEAAETCTVDLKSGFGALAANALSYAPARIHLTLDHLDKKSMTALGEILNNAGKEGVGSDMYGMIIMGKIMALLPDILKRNPTLTLATLNLGTAEGEAITATGHATILGEKAAALPSMALMVQALDAQILAQLPKAFMNTFLDLGKLMQMIDQGLLVSDGKYYRIEATIKGGHLTLNGTPLM